MSPALESERMIARFEAELAPILEAAYKVAYQMAHSTHHAEDLVQEAALQALRAYATFTEGTNFRAWFFKILVNCFRMSYRKRKREPDIDPLDDAPDLYLMARMAGSTARGDENPAATLIGKMSMEQMKLAMESLPEEFRMVCVLYFMEELGYQEIAHILECPVGTVRSRLHRGRKLLQKSLWQVAQDGGIVQHMSEAANDA